METIRAEERYAREQRGAYKIDKKVLKTALKDSMRNRFGKPSGSGHYVTEVGDVKVWTDLDFGVRFGDQFECRQTIATRQLDALLEHGCILALLGSPQTRWGRLTNDDIPATAELVPRLCAEFIDAVPEMWERSGLANKPLSEGGRP